MMRIKQIIWDWNGTLFDDAWLCIEIINELLAKRSLPLTDGERYQKEFVFPIEAYYRELGFDLTLELFEELTKEYMGQYDRRRVECNLQSKANKVLEELSARGFMHSILSATEQTRLEEMVLFNKISDKFTKLIGIDDCYARSKIDRGRQLIETLDCESA